MAKTKQLEENQQTTARSPSPVPLSPSIVAEVYHQIYTSLYAYYAGTLGFLDWLELAEKLLGVRPDRDDQPDT